MATIGILQEQRAVAFRLVLGPDGDEVRGEFHFAILQIDRVSKINNALIMGVSDRHCEIHAPGNALVWTAVAVGLGIENVCARRDFDTSDAGWQVWNR